jgi:hypothetical protein
MAYLSKWTGMAAAGAALSLAGVIGMGPGLAGAQSNNALRHSAAAVSPDAVGLVPGTYIFFINGAADGSITFAANHTFTADVGGDSGTWAQAGKTAGFSITAGADATAGCIFAGHVNDTGTGISFAAKPGHWICPGITGGTFFVEPGPDVATSQTHGAALAQSGVQPDTAGAVKPGTYKWAINGTVDGKITFAKHNTYTSTLDTNDSGSWVQGGSAVAISITGGSDSTGNCLFVGKGNHTGTAIGTTAKPGNWVCAGFGSSGTFFTK